MPRRRPKPRSDYQPGGHRAPRISDERIAELAAIVGAETPSQRKALRDGLEEATRWYFLDLAQVTAPGEGALHRFDDPASDPEALPPTPSRREVAASLGAIVKLLDRIAKAKPGSRKRLEVACSLRETWCYLDDRSRDCLWALYEERFGSDWFAVFQGDDRSVKGESPDGSVDFAKSVEGPRDATKERLRSCCEEARTRVLDAKGWPDWPDPWAFVARRKAPGVRELKPRQTLLFYLVKTYDAVTPGPLKMPSNWEGTRRRPLFDFVSNAAGGEPFGLSWQSDGALTRQIAFAVKSYRKAMLQALNW